MRFVLQRGRASTTVVGWVVVVATTLTVVGCTAEPTATESTSSGSMSPVATATPGLSDGPTEEPALPITQGTTDDTIELSTGMTVALESISTKDVKAETPGDVAGSAVEVVVVVKNASSEAQNVDSAVVTLVTPDGELGIPTTAGGSEPMVGTVAPGATTRGRYIFMLDPASGRDITVSVNYSAGEPVAEFTGRTS